ncbi:peptidoglycan recognition protein family protein [uncultured Flavonifractor sp.]|uniref:peptidoglycan recognition protein family protein n=1 Tax=uncultured Flavonifractor sp. TaxID=1193534 RepID=UPI002618E92D|nr:peptidoglycan recognition family protein [uncultured Flavonifractor sp.]
MSNSPLATYTRLSPNRTSPRNHAIDTITIHCTGGQGTAKQILDMAHFNTYDPKNGSSCNYAVGKDGSIGLGVDEGDRSWCSSNGANDHRAITIEVSSESISPYKVTEKALAALIDLLVDICQRNGIKRLVWSESKADRVNHRGGCNMTCHRDFAAKACPGDYLYALEGDIAKSVNKRLNGQTIEEGEIVTYDQWKAFMGQYRAELRKSDGGDWSKEAREWAVNAGIVTGSGEVNGLPVYMWEDLSTREQLITVLYRFAKAIGQA